LPAVIFLTGHGKMLYHFEGYRPPHEFAEEMEKTLAIVKTGPLAI